MQLDLFSSVVSAYIQTGQELSNNDLYAYVANKHGLTAEDFATTPVGTAAVPVSQLKRKIRWYQQTLKHAGVIERVHGKRGVWELVNTESSAGLKEILPNQAVLGFSTDLGIAIIAHCESFFSMINEPIHLIVTSPPYPLSRPRKYGNPSEKDYVDWICRTLEPVIKNLVPGGSICLNVGNDIFMSGTPARSLYRERLLIALNERFGLHKMDELIWVANKAPGPFQWASKKRVQLNVGYEPVYWLTNDPLKVRSDNRRVLQPHTDKHISFVRSGGVRKRTVHSDGAYHKLPGSYCKETQGRIPRNIQSFTTTKDDMNAAYRAYCETRGYALHGASMPIALPSFLINFLTEEDELVVDPMAGRLKVGMAAETLKRRWICTDKIADYVLGSRVCFGL